MGEKQSNCDQVLIIGTVTVKSQSVRMVSFRK